MSAELISKEPGNVWCPYYHALVDGKVYYVYERYVYVGSGMVANLPDHCVFYLIDKASYDAENVTRGEYLHRTSNKPWREEESLIIEALRARQNSLPT